MSANGSTLQPLLSGRVLVWPEAFSEEECAMIAGQFDDAQFSGPALVRDPSRAYELGLLCGARMPGAPALQWLDWITLPRFGRCVGWHLDEPKNATHKLCLYLDPGPGTEFRADEDTVVAGGGLGSIVLFDVRLEHRTAEGEARRVLGLRARRILP